MPNETILIVEDSPTERRGMAALLEQHGYAVVTAADGDEALAKVTSEKPRLVLLDIILPKSNGFQVCRRLKSAPATRDLKVILVSSKTQESDRFWGLKQGADDYVMKPFTPEQLLGAVARQL
jgi:twitching motility two-component system response regulator PilH